MDANLDSGECVQRVIETFKMWCCKRTVKIKWMCKVTNKRVLEKWKKGNVGGEVKWQDETGWLRYPGLTDTGGENVVNGETQRKAELKYTTQIRCV